MFSERHLLSGKLSEKVENISVVHTSVEIETKVPKFKTIVPKVINLVLAVLVVGFQESFIVIASPEVVQVIIPLVEVWVCLGAHGHAEFKEGQSFEHLVVTFVDLISVVIVKYHIKHVIKVVMMCATFHDVVTLIYVTFFCNVNNTSGELGSCIDG